MKKLFFALALLSGSSFAAHAYMLNLSCKAIQTVSPDYFPTSQEWDEYVAEMERLECGGGTGGDPTQPQPSVSPDEGENP